ncbi:MAG: hypothetical protein NTV01_01825 [Bacteroidia bacterium]|nr:hypothetical protein [Bacteroidia bacterium]
MNNAFDKKQAEQQKQANLNYLYQMGKAGITSKIADSGSGMAGFKLKAAQTLSILHQMGGAMYAVQTTATFIAGTMKDIAAPMVMGVKIAEDMKHQQVTLTGLIAMSMKQRKGESIDEMYKRAAEYARTIMLYARQWDKYTSASAQDIRDVMQELVAMGITIRPGDKNWIVKIADYLATSTEAGSKGGMQRTHQIQQEMRAFRTGISQGATMFKTFKYRLPGYQGLTDQEVSAKFIKDAQSGKMESGVAKLPDPEKAGSMGLIESQWSTTMSTLQTVTASAFADIQKSISDDLKKLNNYLQQPDNFFTRLIQYTAVLTEKGIALMRLFAPPAVAIAKASAGLVGAAVPPAAPVVKVAGYIFKGVTRDLTIIGKMIQEVNRVNTGMGTQYQNTNLPEGVKNVLGAMHGIFSFGGKAAAGTGVFKNALKTGTGTEVELETQEQRDEKAEKRRLAAEAKKKREEAKKKREEERRDENSRKNKEAAEKRAQEKLERDEASALRKTRNITQTDKAVLDAQKAADDAQSIADKRQKHADKTGKPGDQKDANAAQKYANKLQGKADKAYSGSRNQKQLYSSGQTKSQMIREQSGMFGGEAITAEQGKQLAEKFERNMSPLQEAMASYGEQTANLWNNLSGAVTDATAEMFYGVMKNFDSTADMLQNFMQNISDAIVGLLAKLAAVWTAVFVMSGFNPAAAGNAVSAILSQYAAPAGAIDPAKFVGPVQKFAVGSQYLPRDMLLYAHRGERIVTSGDNKRQMSGSTNQSVSDRPIEVIVDFGPGEMLRLTKKIDQASYQRSVTGR